MNDRSHTIQSVIRKIVSQFLIFNQNGITHQHNLTPLNHGEFFDVNGFMTLTEERTFEDWLPEFSRNTFWAFLIGHLMGDSASNHALIRHVL